MYKYAALTDNVDLQEKMSDEQVEDYTISELLFSVIVVASLNRRWNTARLMPTWLAMSSMVTCSLRWLDR